MSAETKTNWSLIGMLVVWGATLATFIWNVAITQSQTESRLIAVEKDIVDLDARLDTAEAFRLEIRSDLAEIKTDLVWIRRQLDKE